MRKNVAFTALAVVCLFVASASSQGNGGGNGPNCSNGHGGGNNNNNGNDQVHHDSSLKGTGRHNDPLGIANGGVTTARLANGAVTAGKLATANTPLAGQMLGFNGTGMQWVTPPSGGGGGTGPAPLRIVDGSGNEVGIPVDPAYVGEPQVVRYFAADGTFVTFSVSPNGILNNQAFAYYESSDCTGPSYMLGVSPGFTQTGMRIGSLFYYPTGVNQSRHIFSQQIGTGPCEMTDFFGDFSQVTIVPISELGTPPFKLAR